MFSCKLKLQVCDVFLVTQTIAKDHPRVVGIRDTESVQVRKCICVCYISIHTFYNYNPLSPVLAPITSMLSLALMRVGGTVEVNTYSTQTTPTSYVSMLARVDHCAM